MGSVFSQLTMDLQLNLFKTRCEISMKRINDEKIVCYYGFFIKEKNFVFQHICNFLFYLQHVMLMNMQIDTGACNMITFQGCRLHWPSSVADPRGAKGVMPPSPIKSIHKKVPSKTAIFMLLANPLPPGRWIGYCSTFINAKLKVGNIGILVLWRVCENFYWLDGHGKHFKEIVIISNPHS